MAPSQPAPKCHPDELALPVRDSQQAEQAEQASKTSGVSKDAGKTPPPAFSYEVIPSRVKSNVPLKVKPSNIPNAGRGLFVSKAVKAGDLIFSIDRPLLCIDDNCETDHTSCDNCFATRMEFRAQQKAFVTVRDENLQLFTCGKCRLMNYCSKKCQAAAWKSHHKFECSILAAMRASELRSVVSGRRLRCMLRLLLLHLNQMWSENEWAELRSLHQDFELKKYIPGFITEIEQIADKLIDVTKTKLSKQEIMELITAMCNNDLMISLPFLKGNSGLLIPSVPLVTVGGFCLDPFAAIINHNCEPNSYWSSEGRQFYVRAVKAIPAGEEITFCYSGQRGDEVKRKTEHLASWLFTCTCKLCKKPPSGMQGPFRDGILALEEMFHFFHRPTAIQLQVIEGCIAEMKKAGFGYGVYPMAQLHHHALKAYVGNGNTTEALRTALKLYYLIEPSQTPVPFGWEIINTMYSLINIINLSYEVDCPLKGAMPFIYFHLRFKLVADCEKWFGKDSTISIHEKKVWEDQVEEMKLASGGPGWVLSVHSFGKTKAQRQMFTTNMNKLLEWAGVPAVKEKDFF